jgi:hypothetical protein
MGSYLTDQIKFAILYIGVRTNIGIITANTVNLKGGSADTFTFLYQVKRVYSNRPLFDPIPYDFLRVA